MDIDQNNRREHIVIDEVMKRTPCIAGRATTCWKVHVDGDESETPLVVKDSWQFPEREEEGELLREATEKGVVNVARYHHHLTVRVGDMDDDVCRNVRRGLDITKATNYGPKSSMPLPNRVHRHVILKDFGKPIYKASSPASLLAALQCCIEGHKSLHTNAAILQRDISPNKLMVNEEHGNQSWPAFLIDLDLAIKVQREKPSGARAKTGTRAFMAIGVLHDDEPHSFMHDLESFFWVLFWICIHYDGPKQGRNVEQFDKWNYHNTMELAFVKSGIVVDERDFLVVAQTYFTPYYRKLIDCVNQLRRTVFPTGKRWQHENPKLYSEMNGVLRAAEEKLQELER